MIFIEGRWRHTEESKEKMAAAKRGVSRSEEFKRRNSEIKKGQIPWNKGVPQSEERRQKNSESHKGLPSGNKGKHPSVEQNIKNSERQKGKRTGADNHFFGKHHTPEANKANSDWHKGKKCGKDNPSWKGGTSYLPYCPKFNFQKREEVRDKFERKCFLCNKPESENGGKRLSVHHIDYDKDQGCNGKTFELVPLCISCHSKTNGERDSQRIMIINKLRSMNGSF